MLRKHQKGKQQRTRADHRPMLPELREPLNPRDEAIRSGRCEDKLIDPKEYVNWR